MMSLTAAVTRVRAWLGLAPPASSTFSGPIDALIHGVWGPIWQTGGPVTRDEAMTVSAVCRGRDEICSISTLPLVNFRGTEALPNRFLDQPDPDVARVVMFAQTVEDLLFDGIAWWEITARDYRGFPTAARRAVNVTLQPPGDARTPAPLPSGEDPRGASVWVDGRQVPAVSMIRFDSPGRPLLTSAHRIIRRALLLDALAAMYADNPRPLETFTDTDDQTVRAFTDSEIIAFLAMYKTARKRGAPAWIPKQAQRMDISTPSPAELQLVELQKQAGIELANHLGLDPEDLGISTTSRTYQNEDARRRDKINRVFAPFMVAITDRLSMGDVTPAGQRVRWDLTEYLRPDPATQIIYWQGLKGLGVVDERWIAEQAGVPAAVLRRAQAAAPTSPAPTPALPAGATPGDNVRWLPAQLGPALTAAAMAGTFNAGVAPGMTFSVREFGTTAAAAKADVEKRTITGLAVPYGAVARKYGVGFRFRPGSLEYDAAALHRLRVKDEHRTYIGVHTAVQDSKEGPVVTLKILDGPEGSAMKQHRDGILMDAKEGLADGLSIGVDFDLDPATGDVVWNEQEQVFDVVRATWNETSVTPDPAFTGARVTRVAASRSGGSMNCTHCARPHPAGMACAIAAQLYPLPEQAQQNAAAALQYVQQTGYPGLAPQQPQPGYGYAQPGYPPLAPQQQPQQQPQQYAVQQGPAAAAVLPTGPVSAADLNAALTTAVSGMVQRGEVAAAPSAGQPQEFAQPVNATALPVPGRPGTPFTTAQVTEPDPYRITFDRHGEAVLERGTHEFSTDMITALKDGDVASRDRALAFAQRKMAAIFNVATTDVNELNPTRQRPDMYVDQRQYRFPVWDAINKGTLGDITPFTFPKFNSASSLVAAHVEGAEPSTGAMTTTGQTVTPTAYSGKARINREVWDQGGNPQTSSLIWNQMVRGVYEALEAAAITELNGGSFTALATLTAGNADTGQTLGSEIEGGMAALQFVRGGYAFTDAFAQADLYRALAAAKADDGRALYPMLGPANANGQTQSRFGSIDIAGQLFRPTWALAAAGQTAATKSYLIDRTSVHGWASAPQRLVLDQIAVAYVDLGVWGFQAVAISDTTGVRTITWDPVA